jgi:hypothetical protein
MVLVLAGAAPAGCEVPWADLPATHPDLPTQHIPPSPDPAVAAQAPPCRIDQLRAGRPEGGAAGGTLSYNYELRLGSGPPCRLDGTPDLTPLDGGRPVDVPVDDGAFLPAYRGPVLLDGDHDVQLVLSWSQNWCAPRLHVDTLRMTLPEAPGSLDLVGPGGTPSCYGIPGSGPEPLRVNPFAPVEQRPGHLTSPWRLVRVREQALDLRGEPGERVEFTVTLVAGDDVPLDPCPDYRLQMYGPGVSVDEEHGLNCAAVPYRTADDRPYLPARTPIPFLIQVTAPPSSVGKLIWELEVPLRPITVGGRLLVG